MANEFIVKNGLITPQFNLNGMIFPTTDGSTDQYLKTDGAGNLSWGTPAGGSGGGGTEERLRLNYATTGDADSIDQTSSGISSAVVANGPGGIIEVEFTGHAYPPSTIISYGYDFQNNWYIINAVGRQALGGVTMQLSGGGTPGSPTVFGTFSDSTITLTLSEAQTDAARQLGSTTHAWILFHFGD